MSRLLLGPLLRHVGSTDATVWVETDSPCTVEILGHTEQTWSVGGHHYALVVIEGLEPGSSTPYTVHLDGEAVWPLPESERPHCRIRTVAPGRPVRIAFGSCRYARGDAVAGNDQFDADALDCYARTLASSPESDWPEALIMLGDQVYADDTSPETQDKIRARRDIAEPPGTQVANFEEYTWLYSESWTDPEVRWLLSTVPSSMIFDDHDVIDDWNTSHEWRLKMQATSWWSDRIIGALSSYWVYQHLGNLSPGELADLKLYQQVRASGVDNDPALREFAEAADREADGGKGARWSYRRDLGDVRLLVIDSRCGRILEDNRRSMLSDAEFDWIEEQLEGDYDHLLIGTSLPWLMPRAMHDVESWNERLCAGSRGKLLARWSEKIRQTADLEHWASFRSSFDRLAEMIRKVGDGDYENGTASAPATICVLSGDVHHAYVAQAHYADKIDSPVYQLTCSPLHNYVPLAMRAAFRVAWSRATERVVRAGLDALTHVPELPVHWTREAGPFFGDELMTLRLDGRSAEVTLSKAGKTGEPLALHEVASLRLA